ncbi:MAG TPA: imidazole glycerol phosphate synthase subunit HisF [Thermomicrobiaceae bacterium]|nr:imidazole glycerol phosphate synthase subunit HisF [Thermomicrobiaceae bacterium]
MLTKRIVPCLDIDRGRVVKGTRFLDLRDVGDPVELAERYEAEGADELVLLDITASSDGRAAVLDLLRSAAGRVFIPVTIGGGMRSVEDMREALRAGADKVAVNSAAVARPALIDEAARAFGRQCVVLAVDVRRGSTLSGWEVMTHGGRRQAGLDALVWMQEGAERGAGEILLTSMDQDGTQAGYDLELLEATSAAVSIPLIASGGAGAPEHLRAALEAGADAALAASIFHDRHYGIGAVKEYLAQAGVAVRR